MNFEDIIKKHSYPSDFIPFLKKVYTSLIDYFGVDLEIIIHQAFMDTKFIFNKNVYDALKEEDMLEVNEIVTEADLKRASGVYESIPNISCQDGIFTINSVKRIVVTSTFDKNASYSIGTFIHELCHLIKSYYKEYTIEGNILTKKSGFIEEKYELILEQTGVKRKLISKRNTGLEEGLNSNLEEELMVKYFDPNYKTSGYGGVRLTSNILIEKFNIKEILINAEIYKEDTEILKFFGPQLLEKLNTLLDYIYKLDLDLFANIFNDEAFNEIQAKRANAIDNDFYNLYNEIKDKINTREV